MIARLFLLALRIAAVVTAQEAAWVPLACVLARVAT